MFSEVGKSLFSCAPSNCGGCKPWNEDEADIVKVDPWLLRQISGTHTPPAYDIATLNLDRRLVQPKIDETQEDIFFEDPDSSQISQNVSQSSSFGQENRPQGNRCTEELLRKADLPKTYVTDEHNVPWSPAPLIRRGSSRSPGYASRQPSEAEKAKAEQMRREKEALDKKKVEDFLHQKGFAGVDQKRSKLWKSKYPLHSAVKANDADLVQLLLEAKANPACRNSAGETPVQLARSLNVRGSQTAVLRKFTEARPSVLRRGYLVEGQ